MKYYKAKGPIPNADYKWNISYYKMHPGGYAEAIRIWQDGSISKSTINKFSKYFINLHCREITREKYESILEI